MYHIICLETMGKIDEGGKQKCYVKYTKLEICFVWLKYLGTACSQQNECNSALHKAKLDKGAKATK